jgi:DNA ligase-1
MGSIDLTKFRPMLAASTEDYDWAKLQYPVYVSPKLDGIRCATHPTLGPVSRTLKPIPNGHIRQTLSHPLLKWLDGELTVGPPNAPDVFNRSQSGVMTSAGVPDWTYYVFDNFEAGHMCGFGIRLGDAQRVIDAADVVIGGRYVKLLEHTRVDNYEQLVEQEAKAVADGYEGLMIRSAGGKYKFGRSTQREQGLLKMKRFTDDEAIIEGYELLQLNQNDPVIDALGLQKRGYSKEGKVDDPTRIGKLLVRGAAGSRWHGISFSIGSGLDDSTRRDFLARFDEIRGKTVSYKYQAHGSLDAPRMPIFKGIRHD